jgi:hypothetical protein
MGIDAKVAVAQQPHAGDRFDFVHVTGDMRTGAIFGPAEVVVARGDEDVVKGDGVSMHGENDQLSTVNCQ